MFSVLYWKYPRITETNTFYNLHKPSTFSCFTSQKQHPIFNLPGPSRHDYRHHEPHSTQLEHVAAGQRLELLPKCRRSQWILEFNSLLKTFVCPRYVIKCHTEIPNPTKIKRLSHWLRRVSFFGGNILQIPCNSKGLLLQVIQVMTDAGFDEPQLLEVYFSLCQCWGELWGL